MRLLVISLSIASAVLLSSCATLSKEQCMVGDWQAIGYNDGVAGYSSDRLTSHAKACAKASIAPDYQAWERGRQIGLKQYCTVDNAYNVGLRGNTLNNVCPVAIANTLRQRHQQGLEIYTLTKQLEESEKLLEKYQSEYDKLRNGEMLDFATEKEARAYLLSLPLESQKIRHQMNTAERKLALLETLD